MINPLIWFSGVLLLFYSYGWFAPMPLSFSVGGAALLHTAAAYMMLFFFIAHVYLATTGKTPLAYIKAMITGWEEMPGAGERKA